MIFPWQTTQWQQLINSKQQNCLPHALIFLGASGMGKKEFAHAFANSILCKQPDTTGKPCETCHSCHMLRANTHPDLVLVEPEQSSHIIKVDQIRETVNFVNESSQQGGYKVIIINPAHAMNINAANALLKTLEEPSPNTLFILICDPNLRLPATINSRCQKIIFSKPDTETALNWLRSQLNDNPHHPSLLLNLADGAPLKARDLVASGMMTLRQDLYRGLHQLSQKQADPLQVAVQHQEADLLTLYNLLLSWMKDLLRFKLSNGEYDLINTDYHNEIAELSRKIKRENMLSYLECTQKSYANIVNSLNLNRQLLLEELFINWVRYVSC